MKQMQIPVTLPVSPAKKDKAAHLQQMQTPQVPSDDFCYGTPDPTPAAQRDLYRTCFPDELRRSPDSNSSAENDVALVNRSVQAFNTPFPIRPAADVVLGEFRLAVLQPPTPFHVSQIPVVDDSDEQQEEVLPVQNPVLPIIPHISASPALVVDPMPPEEPTVQPTTEQPPVPDSNTVNVEYASWSLLPTRKFSGFFVEGRNMATGMRANSSRIVERIDSLIVKSGSGAVIRLIGAPDEKRMLSFYISRSFISLFSKGFPTDWTILVDSEMNRLQNAGANIRDRIQKLLKDLTSTHHPMSHSRDVSMMSASMLSALATKPKSTTGRKVSQVSSACRLEKVDEDKTLQLPPIAETSDAEEPRMGRHLFPIETFTPRNKAVLPVEDEEEDVREEGDPNSSSSVVESPDLSEVDDRKHYQRRRARQGNKAARKKEKKTAAKRKKKPSSKSNAKTKKTQVEAAKPVVEKAPDAQQKAKSQEDVTSVSTIKKKELVKNSSAQKEEHPSLPTDLNPPFASRTRGNGRKVVSTVDLRSQIEAKSTKMATRQEKEPPPPPPQEVRKKTAKTEEKQQQAKKTENAKAAKRRSQEAVPEVESKPKKSKNVVAEEQPVGAARNRPVAVEKMAEETGPRTRRAARKVIEEEEAPVQVKRPPTPPKKKMTTRSSSENATQRKQPSERRKNGEYDFLLECPPKKATELRESRNIRQPAAVQEVKQRQKAQPKPIAPEPVPEPNATSSATVRPWSEGEIDRLKRAVIQVPTTASDYWKAVSNMVATRNEEECFAMYNKRMDIQKSTHCNLMLSKLLPNAETSLNCPPFPPEKSSKTKAKKAIPQPEPAVETKVGKKKVITAGVGTLKRREQIRAIVQEEAAEAWLSAPQNDADSRRGGGLTESERAALIGENMALITPSGAVGSHSIVTAGGQALSGLESDGHASSMISSALEMPTSSKDRDADRLVQRMRENKAPAASKMKGSKAPAGQTMRKQAMGLDHLSPMGGNLKGFLPKNMSTPQIPAGFRRRDDEDDDDSLPDSPSTLTDKANNKKKNPISPIYRR